MTSRPVPIAPKQVIWATVGSASHLMLLKEMLWAVAAKVSRVVRPLVVCLDAQCMAVALALKAVAFAAYQHWQPATVHKVPRL